MIDAIARYDAGKFLRNMGQGSIVEEFLAGRVQWVGFPKQILVAD